MKIAQFETEHFFARYEFNMPYQLCNSDCETTTVAELLEMAGVPLSNLGDLKLGYTESQGNPVLREMIAETYDGVGAEEVVVLGAPVEGIYLLARVALNPGDEVIVLSPAYDALVNMFAHVVGEDHVKRWQFIPGEVSWVLDFDQLESLVNEKTRLLVVNFPHNPTGFLPTPAKLDRLAAFAEKHDLILFCDEMYYGLVHSGSQPVPSAVEKTKNAVVLSGLSKTYGLPGLRTGWLVVPDEELRANMINWKFYTTICPPAPSEFLAAAAWSVRDHLLARSLKLIEKNLTLAEAFFIRWSDRFTWRRPMAGSVALVGVDVPSVTALSETLANEAGVLIQPATTLGYDDQHMRMGFGRAGFAEALEKFEHFLLENRIGV
jgi:aspartate/methionine/tyrosine aminotransferase